MKRPTEGEVEVPDTTLEVEHNSGSLKPSSSLNSTLPQCEDLDRADRLLRAQYLQHQGERPRSQSTPTEDDFLNIKTSTYDHLLYPSPPTTRSISEASAPGEQVHRRPTIPYRRSSTPMTPTPRITIEPLEARQDVSRNQRYTSGKPSTQSQTPDTAPTIIRLSEAHLDAASDQHQNPDTASPITRPAPDT